MRSANLGIGSGTRRNSRVGRRAWEQDWAAVAQVICIVSASLAGDTRHSGAARQAAADVAALWSRLDEIDGRLDEIAKLVSGLKTEIATVIAHVRDR